MQNVLGTLTTIYCCKKLNKKHLSGQQIWSQASSERKMRKQNISHGETSVDDDKGSRRLPKKIEERLIRGKYKEVPTSDYGVKHKASLLIMRIYTCVLMLYKGRRSSTHPVYSLFKFQSKFMFCKCKTVFLLLMQLMGLFYTKFKLTLGVITYR